MKLVHLQRLLPLEQILSSLPGAARPPVTNPRPAQAIPVQAPRPAPAPVEPVKPKAPAPSPFELDRQRKQSAEEPEERPVVAPVAAPIEVPAQKAVEPEPPPAKLMETKPDDTDLGKLRDVVTAALDEQGHNTAASLLGAGHWKLDEDGAIQVEVGVKKTMLGLTMNGEAWKIVREALRGAGATQKMTVVSGETAAEPSSGAPRTWSRDSIEAVALGNPLVRQAQELFQAEVRSVLDLRDKGKG
jgi:DNA polymerase-3 subunit gamma/tau